MSIMSKIKQFLFEFLNLNSFEAEMVRERTRIDALEAENYRLKSMFEEMNTHFRTEVQLLGNNLTEQRQQLTESYNSEFTRRFEQWHPLLSASVEKRLAEQYKQLTEAYNLEFTRRFEQWHPLIYQELDRRIVENCTQLTRTIKEESSVVMTKVEDLLTVTLSEQRRQLKSQAGLPARVVFLCEQASLWNSFHTVVTAMQEDPRFEVILVHLWCKEYSADGTFQYQGSDFGKASETIGQQFIESYNPDTGEWLDMKALQPDYVFYMRPYDYYRHEDYYIDAVSKYAKTCYIPYGMTFFGGDVEKLSMPVEFCSKLYYLFLNTPLRKAHVRDFLGNPSNLDDEHLLCLGFPRMDLVSSYRDSSLQSRVNQCRILWLPRWNTQENCCHFFEYKDLLSEYATRNKGCSLILRPHPLCFDNFLKTGEMSQEELDELRHLYNMNEALTLDEEGDYLPSFQESDVLIADETSLIPEYYASGKPVIFCKKESPFSHIKQAISPGLYIVESWDELVQTLDMLRQGNDPLKEIRENIIDSVLLQGGKSAGIRIKEQIEKDFSGI